jgi:hypothetical protein
MRAIPLQALPKGLQDQGWELVCRRKTHGWFGSHQLWADQRHPEGAETGWLTGGLKVLASEAGPNPCPRTTSCARRAAGTAWIRRANVAMVVMWRWWSGAGHTGDGMLENFQHMILTLGQFIQEEHAVVG